MINSGKSKRGYHRLATFSTCQKLYYYQEIAHLEPDVLGEPLALGTLFHAAAAAHYSGEADPVETMRQMPERVSYMFVQAKRVWDRYVEYAEKHDDFRVVSVEEEFAIRLLGEEVTARLDLVVERHGALWIYEHKSTKQNVTYHPREWAGKGQPVLQDAIGRLVLPEVFGIPYGGLIINAVDATGAAAQVVNRERVDDRFTSPWRDTVLMGLANTARQETAAREERGTDALVWMGGNAEACMTKWGVCSHRALCLNGEAHAAMHGFVLAADVATKYREAAGR